MWPQQYPGMRMRRSSGRENTKRTLPFRISRTSILLGACCCIEVLTREQTHALAHEHVHVNSHAQVFSRRKEAVVFCFCYHVPPACARKGFNAADYDIPQSSMLCTTSRRSSRTFCLSTAPSVACVEKMEIERAKRRMSHESWQ